MSLHVNLLNEVELQELTAVNKRLVGVITVAGGGGFLILLLLITVLQASSVKRSLAEFEQRWETIEPGYEVAKSVRDGQRTNSRLLEELNGWSESRVYWQELLGELQRIVPRDIQLGKLEIRGEFIAEYPAEGEEGSVKLARQFRIGITGTAVGERADEIVLGFVKGINQSESFSEIMESVKLQGMKRTASGDEELQARDFSVEAITKKREMK